MKKSSLNLVKLRTSIPNTPKTSPLSTLTGKPFSHRSTIHQKSRSTNSCKAKPNFLSATFSSLSLEQSLNHGYKLASRNFSSTKNPFTTQSANMTPPETFQSRTASSSHCDSDYSYYNDQESCSESVTHSTHLQKHRDVWCVALAPIHLNGLDSIAKTFGKSRQTIKKWCKQGAPIAFDGFSYCSEYMTLFIWFLNNNPSAFEE